MRRPFFLNSTWAGNLRWARNRVSSSGDIRNSKINVLRDVNGAVGGAVTNQVDDRHLRWTLQRAERQERSEFESSGRAFEDPLYLESYPHPKIWFDTTYHQDAAARTDILQRLLQPIIKSGMLSAGYTQVSATGQAAMNGSTVWYYPYTGAVHHYRPRS